MKKTKYPAESVVVDFDFSSELTAVDSAVVSVQVHGIGTDENLPSFLDGAHQISGAHVYQRISGGKYGMKYLLQCLATQGSDIIRRKDIIYVGDN